MANPDTEATEVPASHALPTEFFSIKSLQTLASSAGAVWLCCAVISSIVPKNFFTPQQWRLIALLLSEALAFSFLLNYKYKRHKHQVYILTIINGCLVFVNASGINAVTSGLNFQTPATEASPTSALFPFTNEVDWWPSSELLAQRDSLEQHNIALRAALRNCAQAVAKLPVGFGPSVTTPAATPEKSHAAHHTKAVYRARPAPLHKETSQAASLPTPSKGNVTAAPSAAITTPSNVWRAISPTVTPAQITRSATALGSGCVFTITVDSLTTDFAGQDSILRSRVCFRVQERNRTCRIPPYATPSRQQKFIATSFVPNKNGTVSATYSDVSVNPGFYKVAAIGQVARDVFNGRFVIERMPRVNHPYFRQEFALRFSIGHGGR